MANPHRGDVEFVSGNKTYTLRYSHSALVELENSLNKNLMQIMREVGDIETLRMGTIVALLWAGLRKHHPDVTMEGACEILDDIDGGAREAINFIGDAFQKAFNAPGSRSTNPPIMAMGTNGIGMPS